MARGRFLGRALFFGLGYLAGTRAGRERYTQIAAGARALVEEVRARLAEADAAAPGSRRASSAEAGRGVDDIRLGG